MGEFDIIRHYFQRKRVDRADILQSVGDDCAITRLEPHQQLAITTDTLVEGTHFLPTISPEDLAYKSVAVNLSDVAAMGAKPVWVSLALTLPKIDHHWLEKFSDGLFEILDRYHVALIGGDTTKGDRLSITITAHGILAEHTGLFRHQAKVGDLIFVSGTLGDSAAGLALLLNPTKTELNHAQQALLQRHLRPTPRVELGQALNGISRCAIDISDGLLADLGHILTRSQVGAALNLEQLPLSQNLQQIYPLVAAQQLALTGGENYELCFTVAPDKVTALNRVLAPLDVPCHCIGKIIEAEKGLVLLQQGQIVPPPTQAGFDHFLDEHDE